MIVKLDKDDNFVSLSVGPDEPSRYKERQSRDWKPKGTPANPWVAPEHRKFAVTMKRYKDPKNGPVGHLIVDKRAQIQIPQKPTYSVFTG